MRSRPGSDTFDRSDFHYRRPGIGPAGVEPEVETPAHACFGHLLMHRLALGKQANTPRPAMFFRQPRAARRAGPARAPKPRRRAMRAGLDAAREHRHRQAGRARHRREEGRLALVALHQAHPRPGLVGGERGDDEAGEARAGAEVEPEPRARGRSAQSCAESAKCRVPGLARGSPGDTRLMRGFHCSSSARCVSSRAIVSRETSKAAGTPRRGSLTRPRARRAAAPASGSASAPPGSSPRSAPPAPASPAAPAPSLSASSADRPAIAA